jgi:putative membrane protein
MEHRRASQTSDTSPIQEARRLVYFAAERTLMAWVRTALGLMALGFVIDRFGLVLRDDATLTAMTAQHTKTFSFWGGTLLVVIGAVMALVAAVRYWRFAYEYRRDHETHTGHGILLGVVFTLLIAFLGFVVAAYLFLPLLKA